jgi:hypothetical protein
LRDRWYEPRILSQHCEPIAGLVSAALRTWRARLSPPVERDQM